MPALSNSFSAESRAVEVATAAGMSCRSRYSSRGNSPGFTGTGWSSRYWSHNSRARARISSKG